MHFSPAQVLLALPILTLAAPVPIDSTNVDVEGNALLAQEKRGPCHINSGWRGQWGVPGGYNRYRTTFSASGINPGTFCQSWRGGSNINCGWAPNIDGGVWRVDANFPGGPQGNALYYNTLGGARNNWRNAYGGCSVGW